MLDCIRLNWVERKARKIREGTGMSVEDNIQYRCEVALGWHPASVLELHDNVSMNNCHARQVGLIHFFRSAYGRRGIGLGR
jgi:hypothetical protein